MGDKSKLLPLSLVLVIGLLFQNCGDLKSIEKQNSNADGTLLSKAKETFVEVDDDFNWARFLVKRLTGVNRGPTDSLIMDVVLQLKNKNTTKAVELITHDKDYYNTFIKELASSMSNRNEDELATLNDFTSTFIGVVRDDINAKELLTGSFYYSGEMGSTTAANLETDIIKSNRHYASLDENQADFSQILEKKETQQLIDQEGNIVDHPDSAGLITTRGFMSEHAYKGSNRRLVEVSFKEFLCSPIVQWADSNNPDDMIGPDVDRFPVGKNSIFQNTCKACHSAMDAYRPAFAHVNFDIDENNDQFAFTRYKYDIQQDRNDLDPTDPHIVPLPQRFVPSKFRRNKDVYNRGFFVTTDQWFNYNVSVKNSKRFGWRSPGEGNGMKEFGKLIAESRAFSKCMSKKIFKRVCGKDLSLTESSELEELADHFENNNYSIRQLSIGVARHKKCFDLGGYYGGGN